MFNRLIQFTKELFEDEPPQQQQLNNNQDRINQEGRAGSERGGPDSAMRSDSGRSDSHWSRRSEDIWSREGLERVMSDVKLQRGYDEKFRRGLVKYGGGVNYQQPNIQKIYDYMVDMKDMHLIVISQHKNQANFKQEIERISQEFHNGYYPLLSSQQGMIIIIRDLFKMLPRSFKSREDEQLNNMTYRLYTYDKLIVYKMTENGVKDNHTFTKTMGRLESLGEESRGYYERVVRLRKTVDVIRRSTVLMKEKVTVKFTKKMKIQKVLYILEKIKSKYQKVISYCEKDLADISLLNFPGLYQIFLIALVNFKSDSQKFTSLKILRKFEDVITKKLISLKKRLKNEVYTELKSLVPNNKMKRTQKLVMLIDLHHKVSEVSKEAINKARVEGKIPRGLELFDDQGMLDTHYNDIINYNPSLNIDRTRELLFGSGSSGGAGSDFSQPHISMNNYYSSTQRNNNDYK